MFTYVIWCDPANNNLLQSDIFTISANGGAGSYLTSYSGWSCTTNRSDIPDAVFNALCQ